MYEDTRRDLKRCVGVEMVLTDRTTTCLGGGGQSSKCSQSSVQATRTRARSPYARNSKCRTVRIKQRAATRAGTTRAAQETLLCERACKSVRSNSPGIRIAGTKPCRRRLPATSKGQCYLRKRRSVPAQAATRTTRALGHCQHSHPNGQWRRPQRLHRAASGQPAPTSRMGQVPKAPAAHTIRAVSRVGTRS